MRKKFPLLSQGVMGWRLSPRGRMKRDGGLREEYRQFETAVYERVPSQLTKAILATVHSSLNPSWSAVLFRLAAIQAVVGAFALLFCPQFGISPTGKMGIMHYLMPYGDAVCMLSCGTLYVGTGIFAACLFLESPQLKVLMRNRVLNIFTVGVASLGTLICLGGEVIVVSALLWLAGAAAGGVIALQLGDLIRHSILGYERT